MYQSVDDLDDYIDFEAEDARERRSLIWKLLILAFIIFALISMFRPLSKAPIDTDNFIKAEAASYRTAIAENPAPLRRARLRDFMTTYPESTRLAAVKAQLEVLDAYEAKAWMTVMDASYNPTLSKFDKLAAIQKYESEWKSNYLGGRDNDLSKLRTALEEDVPLKDRRLKSGPSPIPKTTPDQIMAGGPRPKAVRPVILPPTPRPIAPAPVQTKKYVPEIMRSVTPRYPRRAQRRGIEASVELSLSIDGRGRVRMSELVNIQSDDPRYDRSFIRAAERAALRTRYKPYIVNGVAQPISGVLKRYQFTLAD